MNTPENVQQNGDQSANAKANLPPIAEQARETINQVSSQVRETATQVGEDAARAIADTRRSILDNAYTAKEKASDSLLTAAETIRNEALKLNNDELARQVQRIADAGLAPTHLDTHKHTHLLPPVLDAVAKISEKFGIRWVRRPFDFPLEAEGIAWKKRAVSGALSVVRRRFGKVLARPGCRPTWRSTRRGCRLSSRYCWFGGANAAHSPRRNCPAAR